jgi:hypothetical protein
MILVLSIAGSAIFQPSTSLVGTMVLINSTESQTSHTVSSSDTDITTYSLASNTYSFIMTEAEGYVSQSGGRTAQTLTFKIKYGSSQVGISMLWADYPTVSVIGPFFYKGTAAFGSGGTIHITQSAPAADANTTIFVNAVRVFGII